MDYVVCYVPQSSNRSLTTDPTTTENILVGTYGLCRVGYDGT